MKRGRRTRDSAAPSLANRAYLAIRDQILRGQLRPGMPVSRRRVARELHMSVLPVTDGLRRLQEDGLLETRARVGTRVRIPTRTDVRELYELREALETQAARLFATRATAAERRTISRLASQVDRLFNRLAKSSTTRRSASTSISSTCSSTWRLPITRAAASCDRWSSETTSSS